MFILIIITFPIVTRKTQIFNYNSTNTPYSLKKKVLYAICILLCHLNNIIMTPLGNTNHDIDIINNDTN